MPAKKYRVQLDKEQRGKLETLTRRGTISVRKYKRARILLLADEKSEQGQRKDEEIVELVDTSMSTVNRIRRRFVEEGFEMAFNRRPPRRDYERKLDGNAEAHLIALTCSPPPAGHTRWTLRLLAEKLVTLEQVDIDAVSHETVRQVLKKTKSSPGRRSNG